MNTVSAGKGKYEIFVDYKQVGNDLLIIIRGGKEHIGSITACFDNERSINNIVRKGHKDDVISKQAAINLRNRYGLNTVVLCGIHIDNADDSEISILVNNSLTAIERIKLWKRNKF